MEYQFSLFDQWITKLSYDAAELPDIKEWEKQIKTGKQQAIRHFTNLKTGMEEASLRRYIGHHYQSLQQLIRELYFIKDLHKELLLKALEQIRFFLEINYADLLENKEEEERIFTTLSMEEFAFVVNTLIECDVLKVRSKKGLAQNISKYIRFIGQKNTCSSPDYFYNALFMDKPSTLSSVLKLITKVQGRINKSLRMA